MMTSIVKFIFASCFGCFSLIAGQAIHFEHLGAWPRFQRSGADGDNFPRYADAVVGGNYVYLAGQTAGLRIVDVTDPSDPKAVSSFPTKGNAMAVDLMGDYAVVAESDRNETDSIGFVGEGVYLVDVKDPYNPVARGFLNRHFNPGRMTLGVWDSLAMVGAMDDPFGSDGKLRFVDFGSNGEPVIVADYRAVAYTGSHRESGYVLLQLSNRVAIVDLTNLPAVDEVSDLLFEGEFKSNDVRGNLAVVASNLRRDESHSEGRLVVFDLSNPDVPVELGRFETDFICDVAIVSETGPTGARFIVRTASEVRLHTFQMETGLSVRGRVFTERSCGEIRVEDEMLYAFGGPRGDLGFDIYDVSDGSDPILLGTYSPQAIAHDVAVLERFALLADGLDGVQVIDLSDPSRPVRVAQYTVQGEATWIEIQEQHGLVFVEGGEKGPNHFLKLDLSNPESPIDRSRWTLNSERRVVDIALEGPRLVWVEWDSVNDLGAVREIDHSNESGSLVRRFLTTQRPMKVDVSGDIAFVGFRRAPGGDSEMELQAFSLNSPDGIQRISSVSLDSDGPLPEITDLWIDQDHGWVEVQNCFFGGCFNSRRIEFDVQDPARIRFTGVVIPRDSSFDLLDRLETDRVATMGDLILDATQDGLQVYRRSPSLLEPKRRMEVGAWAETAADGNRWYALVASELGGELRIFSVDDSTVEFVNLSHVKLGRKPHQMIVDDQYLYATGGGVDLMVFEVLTDGSLALLSEFSDTSVNTWGGSLVFSDDYLYVANGSLSVIAVKDKASPQLVANVNLHGDSRDVDVSSGYAYLADGWSGVRILDVADPASPKEVAVIPSWHRSLAVCVSDSCALIADGHAGLQIIDVSDPANPFRLGGYPTEGLARDVEVFDGYAYVTGWSIIEVIDVSVPDRPKLVTSFPMNVSKLLLAGETLLVSGLEGVEVIDALRRVGLGLPQLDETGRLAIPVVGGRVGQSIRIQRSRDLMDWAPWREFTVEQSPMLLTEEGPISNRLFFRIAKP